MRLVSLCPSITETLVALGLKDELVGVTRYCIHPREALAGIRRVGGTKNPDHEAIRELAPDLVLLNEEECRPPDIEALVREHRVDVSHPRRVAEVPELLRHLGRLTARQERAETLAHELEGRLIALASRPTRAFTHATLIWKDPWMSVSDATYIADLLRLAGGRNAFGDRAEDYPIVTEEEVVSAAPDALLLPDEPFRFGRAHRDYWSARLPAARVLLVSGDDLCWHGVRSIRGVDVVTDLFARPPAVPNHGA